MTICGAGIDFDRDLTLGAAEALRRCDVLVYIHKDKTRLSGILSRYLRPGARTVFRGGDSWRLVSAELRKGRSVVYLTYGHPSLFSEGRQLEQACRAAGYPVRVLPGVSAAGSLLAELPALGVRDDGLGFCVTSAERFASGRVSPRGLPLLIFSIENELKEGGRAFFRALLSAYPARHRGWLLRCADVMGPVLAKPVSMAGLKADPGQAGHRMTLLVPPAPERRVRGASKKK